MIMRLVYPGSFDPITRGHIDLIDRGLKICDELTVAVAVAPPKTTLFPYEERIAMIRESLDGYPRVRVDSFDGLLAEYVKRIGASAVLRGLRAVSDFEYEFQMALMNRQLNPDMETIFMMTGEAYSYLSSSIIREIASYGGKIEEFVTPPVARRLVEKFGATGKARS